MFLELLGGGPSNIHTEDTTLTQQKGGQKEHLTVKCFYLLSKN